MRNLAIISIFILLYYWGDRMHSLVVVLKCVYGEGNEKIVSKIFFIFLRYLPWPFILKYFCVLLFLGGINPFTNTLEKKC